MNLTCIVWLISRQSNVLSTSGDRDDSELVRFDEVLDVEVVDIWCKVSRPSREPGGVVQKVDGEIKLTLNSVDEVIYSGLSVLLI